MRKVMLPAAILFLLAAAVALIPVGCDKGSPATYPFSGQINAESDRADAPAQDQAPAAPPAGGGLVGGKENAKKAAAPDATSTRKIVYNGNVQLIVTDLDKAGATLKGIIKECDALLAGSEMTGSAGTPRSGHWRVRVPVKHFDEFMDGVVKIGVPQRNTTDSQDVTDEYYDLADRIKNKRMELETLRGYLQDKKANSQLETILKIETELSRVRGELDQLEGKLRRMKDITALATVDVTMQEQKDYHPAPPPSFINSVQGTFADSLDLLVRFGKGVALVAVALAPWLALIALVAVPAWRIGRRYWKTTPRVETVTPVEESE
jgi:hypothetical protein